MLSSAFWASLKHAQAAFVSNCIAAVSLCRVPMHQYWPSCAEICWQVLDLREQGREEELLLQELALQVTRQCKVRSGRLANVPWVQSAASGCSFLKYGGSGAANDVASQ